MYRGGTGGQHVNKTESAVRIWYRKGTPDQLEMKCQDGRRRTLIGGGDRGARIRTYNFADGRVTDHRIGLTVYKLADILGGAVDHLIDPLAAHDKQERLAAAK